MLIITRKIGEITRIGDETKVMILGIKGNQVRIGIEAPKKIPVHRQEVYMRLKNGKINKLK